MLVITDGLFDHLPFETSGVNAVYLVAVELVSLVGLVFNAASRAKLFSALVNRMIAWGYPISTRFLTGPD